MDPLEEQLKQLVKEACEYPPESPDRQKLLTKIIRLIIKSGKLWKENTPYYEDAWQQTWVYFCLNICEAKTSTEKYNPNRSNVTTWLNIYLKRRLQDYRLETQERKNILVSDTTLPNDENLDFLDNFIAPQDVPPMLNTIKQWAKTDPTGELSKIHIRGRQDITCQLLILRRLPPETSWQELSREFGLNISTLSTFYERQCRPRLRKFGEDHGYL